MKLLATLAAVLLGMSAFAQFTADQKHQVLGEIDDVLTTKAFVPGADLGKWSSLIASRKDSLDAAETPFQFAHVVNDALKELGLSHIALLPGRSRRHWGEGESAQQGFGFRMRSPHLSWIEDDAALLTIPSFEGAYDPDEVAQLALEAQDAKYLVLDLRGDPGGELDNMRQFLGLLLPSDAPIGTFVSRRMAQDFEAAKGTASDPVAIARWAHRELHPAGSGILPFAGKVAVLIDSESASAAEIVADALREDLHAPLVGSPSAGAVLVSVFDRLSYGFRMQFPVGDYVSHEGTRLEGHPLKPDVVAGQDAVAAALAKLKSR